MTFDFVLNSVLLGVGLAMDAFSVSLADGLNDTKMRVRRMIGIAGIFAFFQALMPLIGWTCVHTVASCFEAFQTFIPWIALILLCFIGGKMLVEGIKNKGDEETAGAATFTALLVQGVATSIDALSVGFTISEYGMGMAILAAAIIAAVTFPICFAGLAIGKRFGSKLSSKASILGGSILIIIGIEIFIKGIFF